MAAAAQVEIDKVMKRVTSRVRHLMDEFGKDVAKDLKELISVPVGRAGNRKIRSAPGQPPRRDTGRLHGSVKAETRGALAGSQSDKIRTIVSTSTRYDQFLEKGTARMARRPFAGPTEAKWGRILENRLKLAARHIK